MIHSYTLSSGATMFLCGEHKALAGDSVVADLGRQTGARWNCRVCTIHRRLTGGLAEPVSVLVDKYIVSRFPTGVVFCECMAWRFQKGIPPIDRSCKHTIQVDWSKIEGASVRR